MTDRGGDTFDGERDGPRLNAQHERVLSEVKDGAWHTLSELSVSLGDPMQSISARLRDLRKKKFGGYTIEREYVGSGVWRYRLVSGVAARQPDEPSSTPRPGIGVWLPPSKSSEPPERRTFVKAR